MQNTIFDKYLVNNCFVPLSLSDQYQNDPLFWQFR